jgi:uncharacterized protein
MKIIVMSDTHLSRVNQELELICARYCEGADMVIHCGDWTNAAVLDYFEQYPLEAVAGNMDDYVIHNRLPVKKVIRAMGFRIGIIHGWGSAFGLQHRLRQEFTDVDAILFGHTHQPMQTEEDGIFWFNPGSVFTGRGSLSRSLGILHIEDRIQGEIIAL